jgi:hypothetical protein
LTPSSNTCCETHTSTTTECPRGFCLLRGFCLGCQLSRAYKACVYAGSC